MKRTVLLSGVHVAFAEMTLEDQQYFQQWLASSPDLRTQIDDHRIPTMEDQLQWFARTQQPDRKMFSIIANADKALIGNAGFVDIDPIHKTAAFRITIGNAEYQGKGLGTEATALTLQYGFDELDLQQVTLKVLQTNARAIRTYEKAGFIPLPSSGDTESARLTMTIDRHNFLSRIP